MKLRILLLSILILFLTCTTMHAFSVTLAWDPNTDLILAGYRLYRSQTSGGHVRLCNDPMSTSFVTFIPAEATTVVDDNIPLGKWYWVVTAYSTDDPPLESGFSNEVELPAPEITDFKSVEDVTQP